MDSGCVEHTLKGSCNFPAALPRYSKPFRQATLRPSLVFACRLLPSSLLPAGPLHSSIPNPKPAPFLTSTSHPPQRRLLHSHVGYVGRSAAAAGLREDVQGARRRRGCRRLLLRFFPPFFVRPRRNRAIMGHCSRSSSYSAFGRPVSSPPLVEASHPPAPSA
jgi:hypothetical protein